MSNLPIFDVAGSALQAQSVRLSTLASNLANADSVAGSPGEVYKPLEPVFRATAHASDPALTGVQVAGIVEREEHVGLPDGLHEILQSARAEGLQRVFAR